MKEYTDSLPLKGSLLAYISFSYKTLFLSFLSFLHINISFPYISLVFRSLLIMFINISFPYISLIFLSLIIIFTNTSFSYKPLSSFKDSSNSISTSERALFPKSNSTFDYRPSLARYPTQLIPLYPPKYKEPVRTFPRRIQPVPQPNLSPLFSTPKSILKYFLVALLCSL